MASTGEMGEIDEVHTKDDGAAVNGEVTTKPTEEAINDDNEDNEEEEPVEIDDNVCDSSEDVTDSQEQNGVTIIDEDGNSVDANSVEIASSVDESSQDVTNVDDNSESEEQENGEEGEEEVVEEEEEVEEVEEDDEEEEEEVTEKKVTDKEDVNSIDIDKSVEIKDNELDSKEETNTQDHTIELNDSGEDVMIVESDTPTQNGKEQTSPTKPDVDLSDEPEVINLDTPIKKKKKEPQTLHISPRRSSRNLNKQKSYAETDKEEEEVRKVTPHSDESDIEEVLPQDPLAVGEIEKKKSRNSSPAIVVKDTKRLVEIAAKSSPSSGGGKKEPTLVIIDTNSILSGRGPVPLIPSSKAQMMQRSNTQITSSKSSSVSSYPILPMALPAQGIYPPNMRATITPIPMNTATTSQTQSQAKSTPTPPPAPLLPTLTDDMFVVEAPSFIVPYVYEKPPIKELKQFVKEFRSEIPKKDKSKKDADDKPKSKKDGDDKDDEKSEDDTSESPKEQKDAESEDKSDVEDSDSADPKKPYSYFSSPLGKFFIDIGHNLVQEFVQTDLLRQQKRKRDREGGQNTTTNKNIVSLIKNLEYTKENNEPYKMETKKCEFCSFKTESGLVMAFHLETPHMKNFVYRCNFCPYEVRSPHDILFHMEAEHAVRGRLERAPAFHQCPNCPFEENQKGKLSRHLVACTRKYKPERNLEPPVDWEPPAKIPRVPKMKQNNLATTATVYQALAKSPQQQYQMYTKMQANSMMSRGRGRPSLGTPVISKPVQQSMIRAPAGMVYKQTMAGGSVLVPTSYQLSGNQVYQVVGGQELGGRIGPVGPMAFVPNMSAAASSLTIQQQNTNKQTTKSVHQPSISITPLPRTAATATPSSSTAKPGDSSSKNSFVICEICDGYIKDLEQLRNHMQWIHKVKIHPKMIYNRPPLNCQKCQFRFFTDQGLERHLLGSHGLVTSSMQEAANKSKDAGRCPVCGRVYQWKLLNHVARDHNMTLKPAHLSYKCTVCTATFGMYKQFESHVYSAHSTVAKRVMDKKTPSAAAPKNDTLLKPLKINDEITIIPQPTKSASSAGT